ISTCYFSADFLARSPEGYKSECISRAEPEGGAMSCFSCGGTGKERCARCQGGGKVVHMIGGAWGSTSWTDRCPECSGTGRMKCRACNGAGAAVSKPQQLKGEQCNKCYGRGRR